jgi:GT2 family glycosyltransferase
LNRGKQQQIALPPARLDISVVIVSWNAKSYLEECLTALTESPGRHTTEIIVVDNGSSDGSPEMVEANFPQVRLIKSEQNLGFATANNVGIRESSGRYVSLINSDAKVLGNCLDSLADYLDKHPDVGNVGPKVLNRDMTLQGTCRRFPTLWNNFCQASGLARIFGKSRFFANEHMTFFPHDREMDVDVLVGCFWMVRRAALEDAGLLDEDFFMYAEDVDWCKRCWDSGWRVVFYPEPQAIHYRGGSSANDPVRFAVEQQRAVMHYWAKHHGQLGRFGIGTILFFRSLFRYLWGITSRVFRSSATADDDKRVRVSSACMHALVSSGGGKKE